MKTKLKFMAACACAIGLTLGLPAHARPYPDRSVKLVVPYAAGGAVDMMGRVIAKEMQALTGQAYVIENKGGAGGAIAAAAVAHAVPDGYTILIGATGPNVIGPAVYGPSVGFDPLKDLIPVSLIATTPYVLVTNLALPVKNVSDLVSYIKQHPGKLNFASAGTGGPDHLAGELFKITAGLNATHVPYKGSGPALTALMSGQVQYEFVSPLPAMPLVEAGKLRLLAVTSAHRSAAMPNVPTVAESLPGFEVTPWYGFFVPAGTPPQIVADINKQVRTVMAKPQVQKLLRQRGLDPVTDTSAQFKTFVEAELGKWKSVVKNAGVKAN